MNVEELSQAPAMLYHVTIQLIRAGEKLETQDVRWIRKEINSLNLPFVLLE